MMKTAKIIIWTHRKGGDFYEKRTVNHHCGQSDSWPDVWMREHCRIFSGRIIGIGIGTVCLLARYIPQISWRTVWPIILIVLGIILIIPFKTKQS